MEIESIWPFFFVLAEKLRSKRRGRKKKPTKNKIFKFLGQSTFFSMLFTLLLSSNSGLVFLSIFYVRFQCNEFKNRNSIILFRFQCHTRNGKQKTTKRKTSHQYSEVSKKRENTIESHLPPPFSFLLCRHTI